MKHIAVFFVAAAAALLSGCGTVENNYRSVRDFADHLAASGVQIEYIQPVRADTLRASDGMIVRVAGTQSDIAVYKFDSNAAAMRERLADIEKKGAVYFLGAKYSAVVCGSFVLVEAEKNPRKNDIIAAFKSFR